MIMVNMEKAKAIAHDKRREARAAELTPLDEVIAKRIPGNDAGTAEAARQSIREKYAVVQDEIEAAADVDALKKIITAL